MIKKRQNVAGRLRNSRGFTLVEVIAVLVILGIISAVVISRGISDEEIQLQNEINILKGHLRFAQYRAMNDLPGTKWGIDLTAGASYKLVRVDTNGVTNPLNFPSESSATHKFSGSITASVPGNQVLFNEWGSPGKDYATTATAKTTVTIGSRTIAIIQDTGFLL